MNPMNFKSSLAGVALLFGTISFSFADGGLDQKKRYNLDTKYNSVIEYNTEDGISVYNTGVTLNLKDKSGLGGDFRGAVDGKISEIDSESFDLGTFVKELKVNYEIDTENTVILLSVGKMPTSAKTDRNNPKLVGGVMGVRMSIQPKKIPLVQEWLTKNKLKITRIDITRYDADSEERLETDDLSNMDMTAVAVYLSRGRNLHTFFIHKRPDEDNTYGITSTTLGAAYIFDSKYKPQVFGMTHQSVSSFLDLDLLVLSAGFEPVSGYQTTFSYSKAVESKWNSEQDIYDASVTKTLKRTKKLNVLGTVGVKRQRGDTESGVEGNTYYSRIEVKY